MNLDWYQILIETSAFRARISGNQTIIHMSIWIKGWKNWESLVTTLMMQCALLKITKFSSLKNSNKDSFRNDCPWMSLLKGKIDVKCTLWKQRKDQKRIEAEQRHKDFENRNMFLEAERKLNSKHHDEYSAHYRPGDRTSCRELTSLCKRYVRFIISPIKQVCSIFDGIRKSTFGVWSCWTRMQRKMQVCFQ